MPRLLTRISTSGNFRATSLAAAAVLRSAAKADALFGAIAFSFATAASTDVDVRPLTMTRAPLAHERFRDGVPDTCGAAADERQLACEAEIHARDCTGVNAQKRNWKPTCTRRACDAAVGWPNSRDVIVPA